MVDDATKKAAARASAEQTAAESGVPAAPADVNKMLDMVTDVSIQAFIETAQAELGSFPTSNLLSCMLNGCGRYLLDLDRAATVAMVRALADCWECEPTATADEFVVKARVLHAAQLKLAFIEQSRAQSDA